MLDLTVIVVEILLVFVNVFVSIVLLALTELIQLSALVQTVISCPLGIFAEFPLRKAPPIRPEMKKVENDGSLSVIPL
jgi:hypothetical protein